MKLLKRVTNLLFKNSPVKSINKQIFVPPWAEEKYNSFYKFKHYRK